MIVLLAFILVPLAEIAVFIEIGGLIGLWPTLAVVVLTAIVGTGLLRAQGLATMMRARASVERGEMPVTEVFDGACLLVAGALLLTPGFVTDTVGLLLFVPGVRHALRRALWRHMQSSGQVHIWVGGKSRPGPRRPNDDTVIDGDYRVIDADESEPGAEDAEKRK